MKNKLTGILIIFLLVLIAADYLIERRSAKLDLLDEAVPGYIPTGSSLADRMAKEAIHALTQVGVTFVPVKPTNSASLYLMFVPAEPDLSKWKLTSFSADFVEWRNMNWSSTPRYQGYFVILTGRVKDGGPPAIFVGRVRVPLERLSSDSKSWTTTGTDGPFYREEFSKGVAPPSKFDPSLGRTYKPSATELTGLVHTNGTPLYELDEYEHGVWRGSYVAWPNKQEAEAGRIVKF